MARLRLPRVPVARLARSRALPWGLLVVAVAAAVLFWWMWRGERAEDAVRSEVEATATRFLRALTTFAAETIEEDVEEIRSFATGDFAAEVEETFSDERIEAIRESEARSSGEVRSVFVQSLEGTTAEVFAAVDETIANAASPTPRTELLRIELQLIETPDGWKVSGVEVLQSPGAGLVP